MTVATVEPVADISTITDKATWTTRNGRTYTHPGIPGWEITIQSPRRIRVAGLLDGMTQPAGTYPSWDKAIAAIRYMHGA